MKITVLPIQWLALRKSDIFIDIITNIYIRRKKDGADKCRISTKIICAGFLIIALGAVTFKNIEWNSLLQWWIHI
jgi:hypothetical protein